jgi:hypothetical protein
LQKRKKRAPSTHSLFFTERERKREGGREREERKRERNKRVREMWVK